jgi:hypothetical protein
MKRKHGFPSESWILIWMWAIFFVCANAWALDPAADIERKREHCQRTGAASCWISIERDALRDAGGNIVRHEGVLTINTNVKAVLFRDRTEASYRYFGYFRDIGYHLVQASSNDRERFTFVSQASGKQIAMGSVPHLSPAQLRAVSVAASESDDNNEVVVWSVSPNQLVEEFRYKPKEYALYKFVSWAGDTKVKMDVFTRSNGRVCPKDGFMTIKEEIHLTEDKWIRSTDMDPKAIKCQ